jgi:hypothetical protein
VAVEAGGGDGLGEDDADGDEDGAGAGSEGDGDFDARAFGVLIAAAEAEAALGEIFADGDFFLKAAAADAGEDASFDARAVAARNDAFIDSGRCCARGTIVRIAQLGERFDPDGRRIADAAVAGDTFADFERLQLQLVEINDFAALAEAAFHEKTSESFLGFVRGREVDVPKVGAQVDETNGVEEVVGRVLVDFGDDAGAGAFPHVAIEMAAEVELMTGGKLFGKAQDAAIAADKHGFGGLRESAAVERNPRSLHGHTEADAVTLPKAIG